MCHYYLPCSDARYGQCSLYESSRRVPLGCLEQHRGSAQTQERQSLESEVTRVSTRHITSWYCHLWGEDGALSLASLAFQWAAHACWGESCRYTPTFPTTIRRVQTAIHTHVKCQLWKQSQSSSQTSWWTYSLFINSSVFLCWESGISKLDTLLHVCFMRAEERGSITSLVKLLLVQPKI